MRGSWPSWDSSSVHYARLGVFCQNLMAADRRMTGIKPAYNKILVLIQPRRLVLLSMDFGTLAWMIGAWHSRG
jgi:hypothetical protein